MNKTIKIEEQIKDILKGFNGEKTITPQGQIIGTFLSKDQIKKNLDLIEKIGNNTDILQIIKSTPQIKKTIENESVPPQPLIILISIASVGISLVETLTPILDLIVPGPHQDTRSVSISKITDTILNKLINRTTPEKRWKMIYSKIVANLHGLTLKEKKAFIEDVYKAFVAVECLEAALHIHEDTTDKEALETLYFLDQLNRPIMEHGDETNAKEWPGAEVCNMLYGRIGNGIEKHIRNAAHPHANIKMTVYDGYVVEITGELLHNIKIDADYLKRMHTFITTKYEHVEQLDNVLCAVNEIKFLQNFILLLEAKSYDDIPILTSEEKDKILKTYEKLINAVKQGKLQILYNKQGQASNDFLLSKLEQNFLEIKKLLQDKKSTLSPKDALEQNNGRKRGKKNDKGKRKWQNGG